MRACKRPQRILVLALGAAALLGCGSEISVADKQGAGADTSVASPDGSPLSELARSATVHRDYDNMALMCFIELYSEEGACGSCREPTSEYVRIWQYGVLEPGSYPVETDHPWRTGVGKVGFRMGSCDYGDRLRPTSGSVELHQIGEDTVSLSVNVALETDEHFGDEAEPAGTFTGTATVALCGLSDQPICY